MAHTDLAGSLSPSRVMEEKSPMPMTPPAGYLPERPCSTIPGDNDSPPASPPTKDGYSRQNPFGISQQQSPEDEDTPNTRGGGGRGGGLCEVLLAACCCYALCEVCC
ncbi:hypothetical protein Daus18300_009480 [Diaporthe australafricana]|uniref:Cysteine-rich transmembrane CYSTM domain-containing protein n=1 Tax=Diaporthe australafricana TaxID=127596 RepID=A0ABR3WDS6_9PEZI